MTHKNKSPSILTVLKADKNTCFLLFPSAIIFNMEQVGKQVDVSFFL